MSQVVNIQESGQKIQHIGKRLYWQAVAAAVIGFGAGCESKKFCISPLM